MRRILTGLKGLRPLAEIGRRSRAAIAGHLPVDMQRRRYGDGANNVEPSAVVAKILRGEGETYTGTSADLERIAEHFYRYKQSAAAYERSYRSLKKEIKKLRKHTPVSRSPAELVSVAGKPSIIVASMPKAGTKYVGSTIAGTLGYLKNRSLYTGKFPTNMVLPHMAREFARGGMVVSAHVQGSPTNMRTLLDAGIDRMVLHVRDPRATLYSRFHYARWREILRRRFGEAFFNLSDEDQIDRHIEDFFVKSVDWLTEWVDYLDSDPEMRVLVTTHEQLARDEGAFFRSIFEFYGLAPYGLKAASKDRQRNFRSGSPTEWRENIAPAQIERMTAMIPERVFQRFGWTP